MISNILTVKESIFRLLNILGIYINILEVNVQKKYDFKHVKIYLSSYIIESLFLRRTFNHRVEMFFRTDV